jgi:hypothetical protein
MRSWVIASEDTLTSLHRPVTARASDARSSRIQQLDLRAEITRFTTVGGCAIGAGRRARKARVQLLASERIASPSRAYPMLFKIYW